MAHTEIIDEATPAGTDPASGGASQLRHLKSDIKERMALEHEWTGTNLVDDATHIADGRHSDSTFFNNWLFMTGGF